MADIPEGVIATITGPGGEVIAEVELSGYEPASATESCQVGETIFDAVGKWMEREPA